MTEEVLILTIPWAIFWGASILLIGFCLGVIVMILIAMESKSERDRIGEDDIGY